MKIEFDDGLNFGLGLFETILLHKGKAIFLEEHLNRINSSLSSLGIKTNLLNIEEIENFLKKEKIINNFHENEILKIIISEKNKFFFRKDYHYTNDNFKKGFKIKISSTLRNETSLLTYHKSLNYGDNILEKRKMKSLGYDEPIFLNSKNYITEGATTNIFFINNNIIYTPNISSGLLNGILRQYIISNYPVIEKNIDLEFYHSSDEIFLTNSLLGIMPVSETENKKFLSFEKTKELMKNYNQFLISQTK